MNNHLHIVSFNVPWPADYGGVIDVFYRLRALYRAGVKIHLHCFTYGRPEAPVLNDYCEEVCYYRRDMSPLKFFDSRPFIVSSRDSSELRRRLAEDNYPILLEGLHCCSLLEKGTLLRDRVVMVRAHNVEGDYYSRLAASEQRLWRKTYLKIDASRIRRYESILTQASAVLAISHGDKEKLEQMRCRNVILVSAGHPFDKVVSTPGRGTYALYHGDLSIADNCNAAARLVDHVFQNGHFPLVIAGKNPPEWLKNKVGQHRNISLISSPDDATMQRLIADAQVNILITNQATGLKLKLLNALFTGRHCLVNTAMVQGTGLSGLCHVADSDNELQANVSLLMEQDFNAAEVAQRSVLLSPFSTSHAIEPIISLINND